MEIKQNPVIIKIDNKYILLEKYREDRTYLINPETGKEVKSYEWNLIGIFDTKKELENYLLYQSLFEEIEIIGLKNKKKFYDYLLLGNSKLIYEKLKKYKEIKLNNKNIKLNDLLGILKENGININIYKNLEQLKIIEEKYNLKLIDLVNNNIQTKNFLKQNVLSSKIHAKEIEELNINPNILNKNYVNIDEIITNKDLQYLKILSIKYPEEVLNSKLLNKLSIDELMKYVFNNKKIVYLLINEEMLNKTSELLLKLFNNKNFKIFLSNIENILFKNKEEYKTITKELLNKRKLLNELKKETEFIEKIKKQNSKEIPDFIQKNILKYPEFFKIMLKINKEENDIKKQKELLENLFNKFKRYIKIGDTDEEKIIKFKKLIEKLLLYRKNNEINIYNQEIFKMIKTFFDNDIKKYIKNMNKSSNIKKLKNLIETFIEPSVPEGGASASESASVDIKMEFKNKQEKKQRQEEKIHMYI